jgi:hypothetical protein
MVGVWEEMVGVWAAMVGVWAAMVGVWQIGGFSGEGDDLWVMA